MPTKGKRLANLVEAAESAATYMSQTAVDLEAAADKLKGARHRDARRALKQLAERIEAAARSLALEARAADPQSSRLGAWTGRHLLAGLAIVGSAAVEGGVEAEVVVHIEHANQAAEKATASLVIVVDEADAVTAQESTAWIDELFEQTAELGNQLNMSASLQDRDFRIELSEGKGGSKADRLAHLSSALAMLRNRIHTLYPLGEGAIYNQLLERLRTINSSMNALQDSAVTDGRASTG